MYCMNKILLDLVLLCGSVAFGNTYDRRHAKCIVCHRVVEEVFYAIGDLRPSLKYETGRYELDAKDIKKSVHLRKSEIVFNELVDSLCKKMGEYVRAFHKPSGKFEVIPLFIDGKMNPELTSYDIIKDGDLESLEFYCESIVSEYEEEMLRLFKEEVSREEYSQSLCRNRDICEPENKAQSKDEF